MSKIGRDVIYKTDIVDEPSPDPKLWQLQIREPDLIERLKWWQQPSSIAIPYYKSQGYKIRKIKDLSEIENPLETQHWAIKINYKVKRTANMLKYNSNSYESLLRNLTGWVARNIQYEDYHFDASVHWRDPKVISWASTAQETFDTRVGICRERTILLLGMLRYLGIESSLFRPHSSHLAVIAKIQDRFILLDPTNNTVTFLKKNEPVAIVWKGRGLYTYGVTPLDSYVLWTLARRRQKTYKKLGRKVNVNEALKAEKESVQKLEPVSTKQQTLQLFESEEPKPERYTRFY